ncbi:MAG TPA: 50S ribosomal protein L3 [Chloroflexi bacterium]|jgi:large subunit ribosomal protein L3|nr:50S ribosomal protein L3 [Chloroflexota bacterium]HAL29063.1 50S ribosomal protein L3 [Chloroflexota bacterium]
MTDETTTKQTEQPRGDEAPRGEQAPDVAKPLILGRKIGMLQHFRPDGSAVAATVIAAEPNVVTAVRTTERDGYTGVQLGYGAVDKKKLQKARLGHLNASGAVVQHLREIRLDSVDGFKAGQAIGVERFQPGDKVDVVGVSKGKGFQGPVHLHHFSRGPKSHGSDHLRRQGSVGSGTTPGRVWKGLRMAAHQGAARVTVKNLEVLRADADRSLLVIAGAVPGARNGIVMVRKA